MTKVDQSIIIIKSSRMPSLDMLRGIMVILMIMQHVMAWVCCPGPAGKIALKIAYIISGCAAPTFIALSGMGASFMYVRHENSDRLLVIRGLSIMFLAYLLNLLTPHWFSPWSWFVLHIIAFSIAVSPLLKRTSSSQLLVVCVLIIMGTVILQHSLNTPAKLYNNYMSDINRPGGLFRLIFAEGHFPIFPWLVFFIAGFLAGQWTLKYQVRKIAHFALLLSGVSIVLSAVYLLGVPCVKKAPWFRVFKPVFNFYPALVPVILLLVSVALLFIAGALYLESKKSLSQSNILVCLGRSSLTIVILHIAIIREAAVWMEFWKTFPLPAAIAFTVGVIALFSFLAYLWQKVNYRYGAEWLVRKIAR